MKWIHVLAILGFVCLTQGQSAREKLNTLAAEFQTWRLKENPETATSRGVYKYNDLLSSYSTDRYDVYKAKVDGFYTRLMDISLTDLSKKDGMSYKMLQNHLETYRDGYPWRFYKNLNAVNFLEGLLQELERFPSSIPVDTKGDVENYFRRLEAWPQQMTDIENSLRLSMTYNTTNHLVTMTRMKPMFERLLNITNSTESSLYIPFKKSLYGPQPGYSDTERTELTARATAAVDAALTSLGQLKTFIENDYKTRPEIGVSSFTNGQEYYRAIMKWYLSLDLTPEEVHETGKQEVARISHLMRKIMTTQGFTGSIKDYFESLNDTKFFYSTSGRNLPGDEKYNVEYLYSTSEEVLDGYRRQITEEIEPKLAQLFNNNPGLPVVVKPMTSDGPQGTYDRGTPDGSVPGTFWANALRPGDLPKYGMMALTMHETNPGHHLQISIAMTSDMPAFRRSIVYDRQFEAPVAFSSFNAFSEGWALYSESLGEEVGLYKDDYELMGRYSSEIFRACRLVVDTGIHYFNWDRERAINYIMNYTSFSRTTTATEIDRYITWPGQALTYKIGELKILELRKKAEAKLAKHFDIKEFHRVILENGRMPLTLTEEHINDWLDNFAPPTQKPASCETSGSTKRALNYHLTFLIFISTFISHTF